MNKMNLRILNNIKNELIYVVLILLCTKSYGQVFPIEQESDSGFVSIFNGSTLEGWTGDPVYWRVENGTMIGEITPETIVKENTFIIYNKPIEGDFELKVQFRVSAEGNSGINYRSERIESKPFALRGYQSDIDGRNKWTGQNYEEKGRQFLALRGQITRIEKDGTRSNHWTLCVISIFLCRQYSQ